MASITNDKTTNGKFRVRSLDGQGNDVELFFDTHIEAQAIANIEIQNKLKYYKEFKVIDGLNQHPAGFSFKEWLTN